MEWIVCDFNLVLQNKQTDLCIDKLALKLPPYPGDGNSWNPEWHHNKDHHWAVYTSHEIHLLLYIRNGEQTAWWSPQSPSTNYHGWPASNWTLFFVSSVALLWHFPSFRHHPVLEYFSKQNKTGMLIILSKLIVYNSTLFNSKSVQKKLRLWVFFGCVEIFLSLHKIVGKNLWVFFLKL